MAAALADDTPGDGDPPNGNLPSPPADQQPTSTVTEGELARQQSDRLRQHRRSKSNWELLAARRSVEDSVTSVDDGAGDEDGAMMADGQDRMATLVRRPSTAVYPAESAYASGQSSPCAGGSGRMSADDLTPTKMCDTHADQDNLLTADSALAPVPQPLVLPTAQMIRRAGGTVTKTPVSLTYSAPLPLAHVTDSPTDLDKYPILGRYLLLRTLGRGTFSVVKLGRHLETGEEFALKIMSKKTLRSVARLQDSVWSEILLLNRLRCRNIVRFVESIETSTHLSIVMEALCDGDMYAFVEQNAPLSELDTAQIFTQVVAGVQFMHERFVCHRDLKLENLFMTREGVVKIGDFGLATVFREGELLHDRCGSEEYASPELILGLPYDGRAVDVWALGVILFTMICGGLPFTANPRRPRQMFTKICCSQYSFPAGIRPTPELRSLIAAMLCRSATDRYTIGQVAAHTFLTALPHSV